MGRLCIYGAGGFGREVLRHAQRRARDTGELVVFASDSKAEIGTLVNGVPVISPAQFQGDDLCSIAVAKAAHRRAMAERCPGFVSLVAEFGAVYPDVQLGEGAIVSDFCIVTSDDRTRIGHHFQMNTHSSVGHDCEIGDFVTLGPHVGVAGNVIIEDDVYIGMGAQIRNGVPGKPLRIGRGATVGMGSIVVRDVPAGATMFGNPAKAMCRGEKLKHAA